MDGQTGWTVLVFFCKTKMSGVISTKQVGTEYGPMAGKRSPVPGTSDIWVGNADGGLHAVCWRRAADGAWRCGARTAAEAPMGWVYASSCDAASSYGGRTENGCAADGWID